MVCFQIRNDKCDSRAPRDARVRIYAARPPGQTARSIFGHEVVLSQATQPKMRIFAKSIVQLSSFLRVWRTAERRGR